MYDIPLIPAAAGLAIACLVVYKLLIYPVFLSPLAQIPNAHPTASFCPLWILWVRQSFKANKIIHAAHVTYGPVVRLGPNEVSINCVNGGLRTVYAGGFEKHVWYGNLFSNYDGVHNMFSTTDSRPHSVRKRMMSNVYSKSYIQTSSALAATSRNIIVARLLPQLAAATASRANIDTFELLNCALMDLVTAYLFGLPHSTDFLQDRPTARWWLGHYQSRKKFVFWPQELPGLTRAFAVCGINLSPPWVAAANADLEAHTLRMCDAAAADAAAATQDDPTTTPVVFAQLTAALGASPTSAKTSPLRVSSAPPRLQVASDMLDHLSAGHETSGITLTYLFHELSQQPALQARLRAELATLSPHMPDPTATLASAAPLPPPKALDALPLLHAVLTETLRLHAAIPGQQPRITPAGGTTLGAFAGIPGGVRVAAQAYSLHRNEAVFPGAEAWRPERWLVGEGKELGSEADRAADRERRAEMHRWFWAFGSGGRMCVGSNLAMQLMKLLVAAIVANFQVRLVSDEGIEQEDAYTAKPIGETPLVLRLERV